MGWIVLLKESGECGNRLVTYAFLLSFAKEHSAKLSNLCFWRYARYFSVPTRFSEKPGRDKLTNRDERFISNLDRSAGVLLQSCVKSIRVDGVRRRFSFDGTYICNPSELAMRSVGAMASRLHTAAKALARETTKPENPWDHQCTIVRASGFRGAALFDQDLVGKHAAFVRQRFRPAAQYQEQIDTFVGNLRRDFDVLVGVHIRRGDYKRYRGGKWSFSNDNYSQWMWEISNQYKSKKVCFIISSNETIDTVPFGSLSVRHAPGHFILDMYVLAKCDLIVGAPSTFSGWASFVGEVPIAFATEAGQSLDPSTAAVWKPQYY